MPTLLSRSLFSQLIVGSGESRPGEDLYGISIALLNQSVDQSLSAPLIAPTANWGGVRCPYSRRREEYVGNKEWWAMPTLLSRSLFSRLIVGSGESRPGGRSYGSSVGLSQRGQGGGTPPLRMCEVMI